jgi:transcriptional regulator with XRE-family HTH domain
MEHVTSRQSGLTALYFYYRLSLSFFFSTPLPSGKRGWREEVCYVIYTSVVITSEVVELCAASQTIPYAFYAMIVLYYIVSYRYDTSHMSSHTRSAFADLCRNLRIERGLKQREVAAQIGIELSTYGNLESSRFKVISDRRAEKLSKFYGLAGDAHDAFMAASQRCPLSPGGEIRRATWAKRNTQRAKAKSHDALKLALINLLGAHLMALPDSDLCACEFGGAACPTCAALESVGLPPFAAQPDRDVVLQSLTKISSDIGAVSA